MSVGKVPVKKETGGVTSAKETKLEHIMEHVSAILSACQPCLHSSGAELSWWVLVSGDVRY